MAAARKFHRKANSKFTGRTKPIHLEQDSLIRAAFATDSSGRNRDETSSSLYGVVQGMCGLYGRLS